MHPKMTTNPAPTFHSQIPTHLLATECGPGLLLAVAAAGCPARARRMLLLLLLQMLVPIVDGEVEDAISMVAGLHFKDETGRRTVGRRHVEGEEQRRRLMVAEKRGKAGSNTACRCCCRWR
jgi:hypothetical protein